MLLMFLKTIASESFGRLFIGIAHLTITDSGGSNYEVLRHEFCVLF
jgi:hypothetical protein